MIKILNMNHVEYDLGANYVSRIYLRSTGKDDSRGLEIRIVN